MFMFPESKSMSRSKDEFAGGAWEFLRPHMIKYIDSLRERQGNIYFASADWAMGWRGFIDGAIEDGTRATMEIRTELQTLACSRL
jgi:monoamine oxidase